MVSFWVKLPLPCAKKTPSRLCKSSFGQSNHFEGEIWIEDSLRQWIRRLYKLTTLNTDRFRWFGKPFGSGGSIFAGLGEFFVQFLLMFWPKLPYYYAKKVEDRWRPFRTVKSSQNDLDFWIQATSWSGEGIPGSISYQSEV